MKQITPVKKLSKKAQKAYYSKRRGSWNGICPATRTMPNGRAYDRERVKRRERAAAEYEE